jgi:hypothetical protein
LTAYLTDPSVHERAEQRAAAGRGVEKAVGRGPAAEPGRGDCWEQPREADVTVPASAGASDPPQWQVIDKTGQFEWHDHRIHWMSPVTPPQVKNKNKLTKIFD